MSREADHHFHKNREGRREEGQGDGGRRARGRVGKGPRERGVSKYQNTHNTHKTLTRAPQGLKLFV